MTEINVANGKTIITNESFNFQVEINRDCRIENRYGDYVPGQKNLWSADLFCEGIGEPASILVRKWNGDSLDKYKLLSTGELAPYTIVYESEDGENIIYNYKNIQPNRFMFTEDEYGSMTLLIVGKEKDKIFKIDSMVIHDNAKIWQEIKGSIKEIEV